MLAVKAYDDLTDDALPSVSLTTTSDASYFELVGNPNVPKEYALKVKKLIDKDVGYVYSFNVYSSHGDFPQEVIKVNVTEKNKYSPVFDPPEYSFLALRDGADANVIDVGTVHATDPDAENYNNAFQYYITDHVASMYLFVDPVTGNIELIENLPPDISNLTFKVMAIDSGSPQQMSTANIVLQITDLTRKFIGLVIVSCFFLLSLLFVHVFHVSRRSLFQIVF